MGCIGRIFYIETYWFFWASALLLTFLTLSTSASVEPLPFPWLIGEGRDRALKATSRVSRGRSWLLNKHMCKSNKLWRHGITHSLFRAFVWIYICFEEKGPMPPTVTEPAATWIVKGVLGCGQHLGCGRSQCPCFWICWDRWRVSLRSQRSRLSSLSLSPAIWWR